jgi:hypothetical protein
MHTFSLQAASHSSTHGRAATEIDRRWLAFWLSMAMPGAGQAYGRHWSAVGWLAACGLLGVAAMQFADWPIRILWVLSSVVLSLTSGEHAKRLSEAQRWPRDRSKPTPSVAVAWHQPRGRSIGATIELRLPISPELLWRRVADLPSFLTIDPFHDRVTLAGGPPRVGMAMTLHHQIFGWALDRQSRLLRWDEGVGYSFSDLSSHCPGEWFPHVFHVDVEPIVDQNKLLVQATSRLRVRVVGKWTNGFIPVCLSRFWVLYVMREHARLLREYL